MTQKQSGAVTKKAEQAVATSTISLADVLKLAGAGQENITQEDKGTPRVSILQQMSPELDSIENAKAGMILSKMDSKVWPGTPGIKVLVCHYDRVYLEWQDRGTGSNAPVNIFHPKDRPNDAVRGADGKMRLSNGNYLEESGNFYVLILDGSVPKPAIISMKGTQLKAARSWNYSLTNEFIQDPNTKQFVPAPTFYRIYNLSTLKTQNDKGSWFIWSISKDEILEDLGLFEAAAKFHTSIKKGEQVIKYDREEIKEDSSEDIPF